MIGLGRARKIKVRRPVRLCPNLVGGGPRGRIRWRTLVFTGLALEQDHYLAMELDSASMDRKQEEAFALRNYALRRIDNAPLSWCHIRYVLKFRSVPY